MKRKTNISVVDNLGIRREVNMIVGQESKGYASGDILDANATKELIGDGESASSSEVSALSDRVTSMEQGVAGINSELNTFKTSTTSAINSIDDDLDSLADNVSNLQSLVSADPSELNTAIDKFEEIVYFLDGVEDTTLNSILANFVQNSTIANVMRSNVVRTVAVLTQADYNALTTKDANTEYNII